MPARASRTARVIAIRARVTRLEYSLQLSIGGYQREVHRYFSRSVDLSQRSSRERSGSTFVVIDNRVPGAAREDFSIERVSPSFRSAWLIWIGRGADCNSIGADRRARELATDHRGHPLERKSWRSKSSDRASLENRVFASRSSTRIQLASAIRWISIGTAMRGLSASIEAAAPASRYTRRRGSRASSSARPNYGQCCGGVPDSESTFAFSSPMSRWGQCLHSPPSPRLVRRETL